VSLYGKLRSLPARVAPLLLLTALTGCGYHQVGSIAPAAPGASTMAVPVFATKVQAYHTELTFTRAVVRELNTRTRYRLLTDVPVDGDGPVPGADSTLRGVITGETVAPLTYDPSSGQTSSYIVSITAQVRLLGADGHVLYKNDAYTFREQYQSTQDLSGFVQEDAAAVRRVAHDFAAGLVSAMLAGTP
jgi:outer membrane lipopolysaccharide assembly protein LptE/RlpB